MCTESRITWADPHPLGAAPHPDQGEEQKLGGKVQGSHLGRIAVGCAWCARSATL